MHNVWHKHCEVFERVTGLETTVPHASVNCFVFAILFSDNVKSPVIRQAKFYMNPLSGKRIMPISQNIGLFRILCGRVENTK